MPYWSIYCLYCGGYIADALLECVPAQKQSLPGYKKVFHGQPGAALACPYCNEPIGFDQSGKPCIPEAGWPIFRYGRAEMELKKQADGEPAHVSLTDWGRRHRFTQPGTHEPLNEYTYAEDAPPNETVP